MGYPYSTNNHSTYEPFLLKTLHILHSEAAPGWGGQEIRVFQECQLLLERGHLVSLVCPSKSPLGEKCLEFKHPNLSYFPLDMKQAFNFSTLFCLIKIIKRSRPDILHSHSSIDSWLVAMAGTLLKIPIVRSRHVMIPIRNNIFNRWLYAKAPSRILVSGRGIAKMVTDHTKVPPEKIISIPAGVDFRKFDFRISGEKVRSELGVGKGQPLIGKIAVIRGWKGYDYFVDCVPLVLDKFSNARFVIVGAGPGYETIRLKIKRMGLSNHVFMLGHRLDIPEIMAALDIQCVASFAVEGTTQVIPQAFAMKTPVVSTRIDSILPILGDGKWGVLVEPKNPQKMANGIIKLINEPDLVQSMVDKAYTFCRNELSVDKMMCRMETIYHEVLSDSNP
jgi:glycosyltransferase involved in cell wall biosynthesis